MNTKRWLLASLAVYIAYEILDYVIHGGLLGSIYEQTASLWRPDMMDKMWIMWVSNAIFSLLFAYIFTKGYEGKGLMEGVRYGLWIGLMIAIPRAYNSYATIAIPYALAFQWWVYGTIQMIICGVIAAAIYKPCEAAKTASASPAA